MDKRVSTPWGMADHVEEMGQGVLWVDTPSHGGIYVPDALLDRIPQEWRDRARKWSGSPNWYEEDCEWASAVVSLRHLFSERQIESALKSIAWRGARCD